MGWNYPAYSYMPNMGVMAHQQAGMGQVYSNMPAQSPAQTAPVAQPTAQGGQGISPVSRIVTSREEAMGVPADFSGSLMVLPDITHNRVFVKRWNYQTGAADFCEYAPIQTDSTEQPGPEYVSLAVFNSTVSRLREEIDGLKKPVGKGGKKNDPDE